MILFFIGIQRGSLFTKRGDPLTPDYPSNEYAFRNKTLADSLLPKIPAQCIGYKTAFEIFKVILIVFALILANSR